MVLTNAADRDKLLDVISGDETEHDKETMFSIENNWASGLWKFLNQEAIPERFADQKPFSEAMLRLLEQKVLKLKQNPSNSSSGYWKFVILKRTRCLPGPETERIRQY